MHNNTYSLSGVSVQTLYAHDAYTYDICRYT